MKSTMKFNPGNLVEIDVLAGEVGSRKVVCLSWAFNQTEIQQKAAARIHQYAEQYSVLV
jgi:hypothetical protein